MNNDYLVINNNNYLIMTINTQHKTYTVQQQNAYDNLK